ncbi:MULTISPECIES: flagellar protein FlaG [Paenibacillus]|uniref:flagellar protein FlaG n=1 Tax=Paenibacillus TaxID=44249 RepID=UPI001F4734AC|nr:MULTISPECIES: flagellar protein FlaG [Paenibacillus]
MDINRINSVQTDKIRTVSSVAHIKPITSATDYQSQELGTKSQLRSEQTKEEQTKFEEQIKKLNESIASSGKELRFKYNDEAKQLYVEVLDQQTQEVLTSLPPEFLIDLSVKMKELVGMFFDEKI